jgi:predicted nucleic acid-binding protein
VYVVDSSVAFLGGVPLELLEAEDYGLAMAANAFLSRATFHGAELHVPFVFLSEVGSVVYKYLIASGRTTFEDGQRIRQAIFGTTWEYHVSVWDTVFELQRALGRVENTNISEFLTLAHDLECEFITTDEELVEDVRRSGIPVTAQLVTEHPWGEQGAIDDHAPTD